MAKDYHNERAFISTQTDAFLHYLNENVLSSKTKHLLDEVATQTDVYIFSGIIRNFLLGFMENRDVDIVITNIKSLSFQNKAFLGCKIISNSFGGYKLYIDNLTIDVWDIESTWGLLHERMKATPNSLIKTAFFNFSSIVFDYTHRRFVFGAEICRFLRTNFMDVVYAKNPNPTLCILNTVYYAKKYRFPIAYKLCKWLNKNYKDNLPFEEVQEKHFHCNIVSTDSLLWMMKVIREALLQTKLKKGQGLRLDFVQRQVILVYEKDMVR